MKNKTLNWQNIFENFIFLCQVNGKRPKTIQWYKEKVTPFIKAVPFEELSVYSVTKYIASLRERGLRPHSIDSHIRAIKAFLHHIYEEGYIQEDISKKIKKIILPKQYPHILNF